MEFIDIFQMYMFWVSSEGSLSDIVDNAVPMISHFKAQDSSIYLLHSELSFEFLWDFKKQEANI